MQRATTFSLLIALVLFSIAAAPASDLAGPGEEEAVSEPSERSKRSVMFPGVVREVLVQEGQPVKADQVVVQLDDRIEQKMLEELNLEANSEARVNYARQDLETKKVQLRRVEEGRRNNVYSIIELEEAQSAVDLAMASLKVAELDHQKNQLARDRQAEKVEQMRVRSPFDGYLAELNVHVGEMADPSEKEGVFLVVRNTPLHVRFTLTSAKAAQLKLGEVLQVRYRGEPDWMPAKIIKLAPVADASSDFQEIKLELSNERGMVSGRQMFVKLPERMLETAKSANANP